MITIGKVEIENFLTIGKATIDLENQGLVAVLGPNGVGKSSLIVESLLYSLFGITERYGRDRDHIVNRFVGKNCRIRLPLKIDEASVLIEVYRKHQKYNDELFLWLNGEDNRGKTNLHTWERIEKLLDMDAIGFQNSIIFGQSMSQYASLSDAQQKAIVERLLGCSWIPIAYKLSSDERNELSNKLEKLADQFDALNEKLDKIKEDVENYKRKSEEFEKNRANRIIQLESEFQDIEPIDLIESLIKDLNVEIETKKVQKENLEILVKNQEMSIKRLDIEISLKESEIKKLGEIYELQDTKDLEHKIFELEQLVKEAENVLVDKDELISKRMKMELEIKELDVTMKLKKNEIDKIKEKVASIKSTKIENVRCNSCGQMITVDSKEDFLIHLKEDELMFANQYQFMNDELTAKQVELIPISKKFEYFSETEKKLKQWSKDLIQLKNNLSDIRNDNLKMENFLKLEAELTQLNSFKTKMVEDKSLVEQLEKLQTLEKLINSLNNQKEIYKKKLIEINTNNARIEERNSNLVKRIEDVKNEINTYQTIMSNLEKELDVLSKQGASLIIDFKVGNEELKYKDFLVNFYSNKGFKSYVIESELPIMDHFAAIYSKVLGNKYNITFSPQTQLKKGEVREKFNVEVVNNRGADVYNGNSSGEKRAIDSIIMFVLGDLAASRLNKKVSVLILDDVFEKLDEKVCDSVIKILKVMATPKESRFEEEYKALPERQSIFVLTHLEYLKSQFNNKMMVNLNENGQTKIERE